MDQIPRLVKRHLICLLLFTCNYVVSVWRGFLFLWVLWMGYVILLWHSVSLPYNYLAPNCRLQVEKVQSEKNDYADDLLALALRSLRVFFQLQRLSLLHTDLFLFPCSYATLQDPVQPVSRTQLEY